MSKNASITSLAGFEHPQSAPSKLVRTPPSKSAAPRAANAYKLPQAEYTLTSGGIQIAAPRVLVVEDDDLQRMFLTDILLSCGFATDSAADGLTAVTKARTGGYSLALIDYQIPKIDGLTTARLMRDVFDGPECPRLIAITASPESLTMHESSSRVEFDAMYAKPLDFPALLACVSYQLKSFEEARLQDTHGARVRGGGGW